MPTGATISYTYTGGDTGTGIFCSDGSIAGFNRATLDGTWQYRRTSTNVTTVTNPQGKVTVVTFGNGQETQRQIYDGAASGTPLQTIITCYNGNNTNPGACVTATPTKPFNEVTQFRSLNGGPYSETDTFYNTNGQITDRNEYDFGAATPLRKTHVDYDTTLGSGIVDHPADVKVTDGAGTLKFETDYIYDEDVSSLQPSGASQLFPPTCTAPSGKCRGNITTVKTYKTAGSWLTRTFSHFDTGLVYQAHDANGAVTTNAYGACGSSFLTNVSEALSLSKSFAWNCTGGVMTSSTDENQKTTNYGYSDANFWRQTSVTFPDGGQTTTSYSTVTPPWSIQTTSKIDNSGNNLIKKTILDTLGRTQQDQLLSDPSGTVFTDSTYDSVGRLASVSNPYRSTSDSTYGITSYAYDALDRPTAITQADGSALTRSYSANTVTVTDEAGKKRKFETDGLGRTTAVWEDPAGLNYEADYQYDTLSNLVRVDQKGNDPNSANWRTRTYTYDMLSQLLSTSDPESGTTSYTYDSNGNLATRTAPAPNQTGSATVTTTYTYDALHRLTQKDYNDGSTQSVFFSYDTCCWWGFSQTNTIGRLQEQWVGTSNSAIAAEIFGYDAMGRPNLNVQCTPLNCASPGFTLNYTYNLDGGMATFTDAVGETYTQTFNGAGRVTQFSNSWVDFEHPAIMASGIQYSPSGAITKMTYGNGLTETDVYNNRLQPCRLNINSSGAVLSSCTGALPSGNVQDYNYGFNLGTSDSGNVASIVGTGTQTLNRTYGYDALNRLGTMADSVASQSCRGLQWVYDPWGNRTQQNATAGSCLSPQFSFDTKNRLSGAPYQYDAAGNLIADGFHNYTYDAENRITQVDGGSTASYLYDASGRRVRKAVGSAQTNYIYGLDGNVISEVDQNSIWNNVYLRLNGKLFAQFSVWQPRTQFVRVDHLGSARLLTGGGPVTRIQSTGGTHTWKYYISGECPSVSGKTYNIRVIVKNQGVTPVKISGNIVDGPVISPGATGLVNFNEVGNGVGCAQIGFVTLNVGDSIDVLAYNPAVVASGVNLIPSSSENFTGWGTYQGSAVTLTQSLPPLTLDSMDYLPFGEQIAGGTGTTHKFTGDERDGETNLDHTWFRQYNSTQGRWITPDPGGLAVSDPGNPQSFNRYAYVMNMPTVATDPLGLMCKNDEFCGGLFGDWSFSFGIGSGLGPCGFDTLAPLFCGGGTAGSQILRTSPVHGFLPGDEIRLADPNAGLAAAVVVAAVTGNWKALLRMGLDPLEQDMWSRALSPISDATNDGTIDDRGLAIINALGRGPVQTLNNPCTIGGWYLASTIAATDMAGIGAEEATTGMAGETGLFPELANAVKNSRALKLLNKAGRWTALGVAWAHDKVVGACTAMQP